MKGLDQLKPLDPYQRVSAATMSREAGITVTGLDGKAWIHGEAGSWVQVSGVDFGTKAASFVVTAMPVTDCTLYAVLDSPDGPVAAQLRIRIPEGEKPVSLSTPIKAEGVHDLYLVGDGEFTLYCWVVKPE